MTEDDFDYEAHERLRGRVANSMDSVLWTYKQNFKAASIYGFLDVGLDLLSTLFAGILTYALIWDQFSVTTMTALAIGIAVISGFKTAARPQKRSTSHFKAGTAYHTLFEEFRDYVTLDLADESTGLERMRDQYEELSARRIELNEEMPDISSIWYRWLTISDKIWRKSVYDEVGTSEHAKKQLTEAANLKPPNGEDVGVSEDLKNSLAGEADLRNKPSSEGDK